MFINKLIGSCFAYFGSLMFSLVSISWSSSLQDSYDVKSASSLIKQKTIIYTPVWDFSLPLFLYFTYKLKASTYILYIIKYINCTWDIPLIKFICIQDIILVVIKISTRIEIQRRHKKPKGNFMLRWTLKIVSSLAFEWGIPNVQSMSLLMIFKNHIGC